jgi:hypothetical protein
MSVLGGSPDIHDLHTAGMRFSQVRVAVCMLGKAGVLESSLQAENSAHTAKKRDLSQIASYCLRRGGDPTSTVY